MELKLENAESKKTQELANLIRAYNRSKREPSKSEPLNIYMSVMIYGDKGLVQKF